MNIKIPKEDKNINRSSILTIYRTGIDGVKREVIPIGSVDRREPIGIFIYKENLF